MAGLRCIQVFLFVILLLEFPAATGGMLFHYGRDGDGVTLPCKNVRDGQNQCDGTTWTYNQDRTRAAKELIELGKIDKDAKDKSDRLNITEDCSLFFNKVKVEDAGLYFCRQYDKLGQERGYGSQVELSVVSLTKHQDGDDVTTLTCSVSTREQCIGRVTWVYNGVEVENGHPDLTISKSSCSANVTFNSGKTFYTSKVPVFKCTVRHGNIIHEFPFRYPSSKKQLDDYMENNIEVTAEKPMTAGMNTPLNPELWWIALVAVVFIALIVAVMVFIIWKRHKGKKRQTNGNIALTSNPAMTQAAPGTSHDLADPEDVSYASISYTSKANSDTQVRSKNDDDTVMYSTVKASSSSAAASTDPSSLYATVNKP